MRCLWLAGSLSLSFSLHPLPFQVSESLQGGPATAPINQTARDPGAGRDLYSSSRKGYIHHPGCCVHGFVSGSERCVSRGGRNRGKGGLTESQPGGAAAEGHGVWQGDIASPTFPLFLSEVSPASCCSLLDFFLTSQENVAAVPGRLERRAPNAFVFCIFRLFTLHGN